MEAIVLLPAILAVMVCVLRSPAAAFLNVYLPVLLLIPDHFRWTVPGLPDPAFQHAAILPIAAMLLMARHARWRFTFTDLLVFGYAGLVAYSEYRAAGWKDAQNLLFDQLCVVVLPYVLAKLLIQPEGNEAVFARRFTVMLAIVAALSLWEFRMGTRLFFESLWGAFFPGAAQLGVQFRWGFGRIGGPYTHAILAGIIFGIGLLLQAWMLHSREWKQRWSGYAVLILLIVGAALTMSRGPWLGVMLGSGVAILGFVKDRKGLATRLCLIAIVIVPPLWQYFEEYTSARITRNQIAEEQLSVVYRANLLDVYMPRIMREAEFGYGSRRIPLHSHYRSIDNHYILLALEHGIVAVALLAAIMTWVCIKLARLGAMRPPLDATGTLAFTLVGTIASIALVIATVYLSAQVEPVLFLLVGWGEGLLAYGSIRTRTGQAPFIKPGLHSFERILT